MGCRMRASVARVGLGDPGGSAPGCVCERLVLKHVDSMLTLAGCVDRHAGPAFLSECNMLCRTALPFIVPKELESWIVCTLSLMYLAPRAGETVTERAKSRVIGSRVALRARLHCVSQSEGIPHSSTSWHSIALTSVSSLALGAPTGKPSLRAAAATQEARRPVSTSWTKRATGKPSTFW